MASSKLMDLKDAVSTLVKDGDLIGTGGLSFWRKPMSACREIVEQNKKDLTICTFVGGIDVDMLIGGGCISKVRASFVGMEVFGMAPHYRTAIENGEIKVSEETEASIALGLKCSYLKVPFMPLRGIIGTDFPNVRDDIKIIEGELVKISPNAKDPDGDELKYSFSAPLDSNGEWQTMKGDAGSYTTIASVSDGELSDLQKVNIYVIATGTDNYAPVLEPIDDKKVEEKSRLRFFIKATDPDGDKLSYEAINLPKGAKVKLENGKIIKFLGMDGAYGKFDDNGEFLIAKFYDGFIKEGEFYKPIDK